MDLFCLVQKDRSILLYLSFPTPRSHSKKPAVLNPAADPSNPSLGEGIFVMFISKSLSTYDSSDEIDLPEYSLAVMFSWNPKKEENLSIGQKSRCRPLKSRFGWVKIEWLYKQIYDYLWVIQLRGITQFQASYYIELESVKVPHIVSRTFYGWFPEKKCWMLVELCSQRYYLLMISPQDRSTRKVLIYHIGSPIWNMVDGSWSTHKENRRKIAFLAPCPTLDLGTLGGRKFVGSFFEW